MRTVRDVDVTCWANILGANAPRITIPKGTRVMIVDDPQGMAYAVEDTALLARLTGNAHDPIYRYVYVPANAVED